MIFVQEFLHFTHLRIWLDLHEKLVILYCNKVLKECRDLYLHELRNALHHNRKNWKESKGNEIN